MASSFVVDATKAARDLSSLPKKEIKRRDAKYHPTLWGDYFIRYSETVAEPSQPVLEGIEKLKKEIRTLLDEENIDLGLIDWIERTGISYHFENEIANSLNHVYQTSTKSNTSSNLYYTALRFRLLRQRGYHVLTDVFERFMDDKGNFNGNIKNDIKGLLSLYEASHMGIKGEVILDEALEFAKEKLLSALPNIKGSLALQVEHALFLPLQRTSHFLRIRRSISCYESEIGRNEAVLELAKLDFNLHQAMHQKELAELTRWYKSIDVAEKLYFSRDRLADLYFWTLEYHYEPYNSRGRSIGLKVSLILSLLDDLYDVYGTLEELEIFTLAVERWDMQILEQSPECFKLVFSIMDNVFEEAEDLLNPYEIYRIGYLKQAMMPYIRSYLVEAKWFFKEHIPTFEEYMNNGFVSCAYPLMTMLSFMGMDSIATEDVFEWALKYPSIIHAASVICRIKNDVIGLQEKQEREDGVSCVECYVKQYRCSEEEAYKALQDIVDDAWKQINYELLHNTEVPKAILMRAVSLAQVISIMYANRDCYTDSSFDLKDAINLVMVQPFTL